MRNTSSAEVWARSSQSSSATPSPPWGQEFSKTSSLAPLEKRNTTELVSSSSEQLKRKASEASTKGFRPISWEESARKGSTSTSMRLPRRSSSPKSKTRTEFQWFYNFVTMLFFVINKNIKKSIFISLLEMSWKFRYDGGYFCYLLLPKKMKSRLYFRKKITLEFLLTGNCSKNRMLKK